MSLELVPGSTALADLERLWRDGEAATLDPAARPAMRAAADLVARAAAGDTAVYGVNTGFGKLASLKIAPEDVATLQRNLVLSHCCGVGEALEVPTTRLMMALKLCRSGAAPRACGWPRSI